VLPDRVQVVGSVKYDPEDIHVDPTFPERVLCDLGIDRSRPVILGGSTHAGEERILAEVFLRWRQEFPSIFLIIAPRHAERALEIRRQLERLGLRVTLRNRSTPIRDASPDCMILDTTGELRDWYGVADAVFVGKSLTAHGGQNPVEAIAAGKPIVFGPHMENFAMLARSLIAHGGAIKISSAAELQQSIIDLLHDPASRERLVENARKVLDIHRGATARTAKLIVDLEPKR